MNSSAFSHLRVFQAEILVAQQFQNARGDVGAFGVEHGVVIGKGDLFQDALGAILVEGSPAAVFALEGEHPIQAAPEGRVAPRRIGGGDFAQGQQDHGRVVHVRVPFVVELEDPAAGFDVRRVLVLPVAAETDLAVNAANRRP